MQKMTPTAVTIAGTDPGEIKLDLQIKKVLACKPILSMILKEVVKECRDLTLEQMMDCIEGNPQIEKVPMDPGWSNTIFGQSEEDFQNGEGLIIYDIRTYIRIPGRKEPEAVKILIDLEAQKEEKPGYDIPLRALFYCCRMISAQLNQEFTTRTDDPVKYGNLKKVYSIWICSHTAQVRANSIERYHISREMMYGHNEDHPRYDIMEAIIINISKIHNKGENKNVLVSMLTDLLNEDLDKKSKLKALEKYGIPMTVEIEEEVDRMCTYTTYVAKTSEERGEKRGEKRGERRGEAKFGHLMQVLFDKGLIEDARKASVDETVRKELYRKYNIID